jgi:hypothetical protein
MSSGKEGRDTYRVLMGEPEGSRPSGSPRLGWENNIKKGFQEVRLGHGLD